MWYVIQTKTGKEQIVKTNIENCISREYFEECRIFYYEKKKRYQGEWHLEKQRMFPGYLFIATDRIDSLKLQLDTLDQYNRVLGVGDTITPLTEVEERFLKRLAGEDDNVELSYGVQIGDKIMVTEGSLKGLESCIKKIDRHKRRAYIEIKLLGEIRLVEVGLEIVEKV